MTSLPTRCAHTTLGRRGVSTYTVLGFAGYGAAVVLGSVLAALWGLSLVERLIVMFVPPVAFLAVIQVARRIARLARSAHRRRRTVSPAASTVPRREAADQREPLSSGAQHVKKPSPPKYSRPLTS